MFHPQLSGFLQPLGGEYGGYRYILEDTNYMCGYGVEVKLLIDILDKYGLNNMGQVDLLKREHKHQNTNALTKMSFVIMDVVLGNNKLNKNLLMKNNNTNNTNKIDNYFTYIENGIAKDKISILPIIATSYDFNLPQRKDNEI